MNKGLNLHEDISSRYAEHAAACVLPIIQPDRRPVTTEVENEDGSVTIIHGYEDVIRTSNSFEYLRADDLSIDAQLKSGIRLDVNHPISPNTIDVASSAAASIVSIANSLTPSVNNNND